MVPIDLPFTTSFMGENLARFLFLTHRKTRTWYYKGFFHSFNFRLKLGNCVNLKSCPPLKLQYGVVDLLGLKTFQLESLFLWAFMAENLARFLFLTHRKTRTYYKVFFHSRNFRLKLEKIASNTSISLSTPHYDHHNFAPFPNGNRPNTNWKLQL